MLLWWIEPLSVLSALRGVSAGDLAALAIVSFLLILVSVIKWRLFLSRLGIQATIQRLFSLYLLGYFVNLLMPSVLGGDVVRSMYVGKEVDKARSVSATLLERYTGLVAMLVMALIGLWWAPHVTKAITILVVTVSGAACVGSVLLFSRRTTWVLRQLRAPGSVVSMASRVEEGLRHGMQDKGLVVQALLLSVVFHLLTVSNTAAAGWAVGWDAIPLGELFVVVPLILLVGAIPISPQGLGIQEGAFVFFLQGLGCTSGQALALALVLRAKSYVLALLGGAVWLGLQRSSGFKPDGVG
jgi:uncharacterized protein (TIRG00374 family)